MGAAFMGGIFYGILAESHAVCFVLADCRVAFAGLSESEKAAAAEALVGKNAMSGFLALMNAAPADIEKLSGAIADCDGTAAGMAETMQDNLAGQLTILKSRLEELAISFGELLMPSIRMIVGWVQKLVDWLNGMDEGTKKIIVTVALLAAAIGPVLIVIGKVVSEVGTIMTFIPKLVSGFNMLKTAFSALGAGDGRQSYCADCCRCGSCGGRHYPAVSEMRVVPGSWICSVPCGRTFHLLCRASGREYRRRLRVLGN